MQNVLNRCQARDFSEGLLWGQLQLSPLFAAQARQIVFIERSPSLQNLTFGKAQAILRSDQYERQQTGEQSGAKSTMQLMPKS